MGDDRSYCAKTAKSAKTNIFSRYRYYYKNDDVLSGKFNLVNANVRKIKNETDLTISLVMCN